jgi:hypothetical protein
MSRLDIDLSKYKEMFKKDYPDFPVWDWDELIEELYLFLERWYFLEIEWKK